MAASSTGQDEPLQKGQIVASSSCGHYRCSGLSSALRCEHNHNTSYTMEDVDVQFENSVCEVFSELTVCLSEELKDLLSKKRSCWVREWVGRREEMGALSKIFRELAEEDPHEYKKVMRMSVMQFNYLLSLIEPTISKGDTVMRSAIPARTKLEVALLFLATGDSYQSLGLMFRLPANTISYFMPSVLKAIISALQDYLNGSM